MQRRTFAELWLELQQAHNAHTLSTYDRIIGKPDRECLETQPTVPITYDDLGQVIGWGDLDTMLSYKTTAEVPDAEPTRRPEDLASRIKRLEEIVAKLPPTRDAT